jgi:integrase
VPNHAHRFRARVKRAGLPDIPPHNLRHGAATLMLAAGIHPKLVQQRLGHASIAITLDLYSHVSPEMERTAADAIERAVAGYTGEGDAGERIDAFSDGM